MEPTQLYELVSLIVFVCLRGARAAAVYDNRRDAGVEWWGDERAGEMEDSGFYDILVDEEECSDGAIVGDAVGDYAFLGRLVGSESSPSSSDCLLACHRHAQCRGANYYAKGALSSSGGLCELLGDSQEENPRWMRPFPGATHYHRVRCQSGPPSKGAVEEAVVSAEAFFLRNLYAQLSRRLSRF